ncbi:porin [Burkholderia cenocepacia]
MNRICAVLAAGMAISGNAMAQSSVTLYGITDVSIRYLTNASANNGGKVSLENGATTNSRFGIKGVEDLGGGMKAIFNLLGNFSPASGALSNGVLFSRAAFVGLQNRYGTLTFGRQQTAMFDLLVFSFDPLTVGNYSGNEWLPVALANGGRADNMVKYAAKFGGLSFTGGYSFGVNSSSTGPAGYSGQIPGSLSRGSQYSIALSYTAGAISLGGAVQQTRDNSNNRMTVYNLDTTYTVGSLKLFGGYFHGIDNTGFVDNVLYSFGNGTATFTSPKGVNRKDNAFFAGATFRMTPVLQLTWAGYYDHIQNAATNLRGTSFGNGRRYTIVGLAEYSLSTRTQIYGTVDYNHAFGAAAFDFPGNSNQTEVGIGMRHAF